MDESVKLERENPIESASLLSRWLFLWLLKCTPKQNDINYEVEKIPKCLDSLSSSTNGTRIKQIWNTEKEMAMKISSTPSLLRVIMKTYLNEILKYGFLAFIAFIVIKGSQPLVLSKLIKLFMEKNYSMSEMLSYTGVMCCLLFSHSWLVYNITFGNNLLGQKVRVALSALIYEKILRLSQKSLEKATPGKIINLLSNDIARFDQFIVYHFLWIVPVQVSVVIFLLWIQFGAETLVGIIGSATFLIKYQCVSGYFIKANVESVAKKTDLRMRIINEIYFGMEVIKMYTWERPFKNVLHKAREEELKYITRAGLLKGISGGFKFFIERVVLCITVLSFSYLGYPVLADTVFSLAVLLNMFQNSFGYMFPMAMALGPETLVSIKRIEDFLLLDEKEEAEITMVEEKKFGTIRLEKIFASYNGDDAGITCHWVDIPEGILCAVVGVVGSGKSSFLKLILGELPKNTGTMSINGVVSYSSQKPWLFSSTIRKNIIFDQDFDEPRYWETIRVCGLNQDLQQLPNSDQTMVGSRGVTLSGGQRARISLARAVYKKADIYLLDDVLSALDAKVGRHVFEECVLKFLKGKTRVLVSHHLQYLDEVDHIIVFNKGVLETQGTLEDTDRSRNKLTELFPSTEKTHKHMDEIYEPEERTLPTKESLLMKKINEMGNESDYKNEKSYGSTLWEYMKASKSYFGLTSFILISLLGQLTSCFSDYWVTFWTDQESIRQNTTNIEKLGTKSIQNHFQHLLNFSLLSDWVDHVDTEHYHYVTVKINVLRSIYSTIIISLVIFIIVRCVLLIDICIRSSRNLHMDIFRSLIRAPMKFISSSQPGYTLNIFSRDLGIVDNHIPRALNNFFGVITTIPGTLFLIFISNYYMIVLIIVTIPLVIMMTKWFMSSLNVFNQIQAREKSPVFSCVSSTIDGINTIRASKSETHLIEQFDEYQDTHTSAMFLVDSCNCAFGLWLEFLGDFFVMCILLSFIILDQYVYISGSFIGLAIFQSISLVGSFQFGTKAFSETLTFLTNVKRILNYTTLEKEADSSEIYQDNKEDLRNWPRSGKINMQNLSLSYDISEKPVLENLNLEILPSEKIGIVGRTGAGKSSIISALFRMTPFKGSIIIDGIDTKKIPLKTLRQRLSIIPQEPILFSESIRFNLDPLYKYTDEKIWKILDEVELRGLIKSLDCNVSEGEHNYSVGQKQLLCLSRALLEENQIVIMDEATASLDLKTDELIQKTIRNKFKDCTVLTVAHRLTSILDSDRVVVMDSGRIVEFDSPNILLQNPNGRFYKLLEETISNKEKLHSRSDLYVVNENT